MMPENLIRNCATTLQPRVLLMAADEQRAESIAALLTPYVELTCVRNAMELHATLARRRFDALFYLRSQDSAGWKRTVGEMRRSHPELPVIVLSHTEAVLECAEILEAGAFDLLAPPYGDHDLLAAIEQARASTEARSWHASVLLDPSRVG
jgi:DNA-binding NtrC family response regulator